MSTAITEITAIIDEGKPVHEQHDLGGLGGLQREVQGRSLGGLQHEARRRTGKSSPTPMRLSRSLAREGFFQFNTKEILKAGRMVEKTGTELRAEVKLRLKIYRMRCRIFTF